MTPKRYKQIRAVVALFIAFLVSSGLTQGNQLLSFVAVATGFLFLILIKATLPKHMLRDERLETVQEKAARLTYAIFAPTIGIGSFILMIFGTKHIYLLAVGQILAYLSLFLIAIYAISYHFINMQMGGSSDEE